MKNSVGFRTARVAALASMVCAQGPLVLRAQAAPASENGAGILPFLDKFWQGAWGSGFTLNHSGMILH